MKVEQFNRFSLITRNKIYSNIVKHISLNFINL